MTVKKKSEDSSELQIVKWGIGTNGFRVVLLVLVLSMHPIGRGFLTGFGFQFPDQKKLEEATKETTALTFNVKGLTESMHDVQNDIQAIKANNAILNSKVDSLDQTFTGFRVDFQKYRTEKP